MYLDQNGTYRVFHGINILEMEEINLLESDCQILVKNGFNLIRFGIFFELAIPTRPKSENIEFNEKYFEYIRKTIRQAAAFDIHIILVAHQKLLNKQFCGFGFPDWAVRKSTFPYPQKNSFNKSNKYPTKEECFEMEEYLKTEDVGMNFENLYQNQDNLTDYFGLFWQQVAKNYKDEPNVIGYEILNDPSPGNFQRNYYESLWPGWSNRNLIMPFYRAINTYIREVDKNKIIFYQSQVNDFVGSGFDDNVGGDLFRNQEVYSYKLDCGFDFSIQFCTYKNYFSHWLQYSVGKHAQVASILSEFQGQNHQIINNIMNQVDYFQQSWIYNGNITQILTMTQLIRPYANKICASAVIENEFDSQFQVFKLSFRQKFGCITSVYIPFSFEYQCNSCTLKQKENNYCELKSINQSKIISLIVWRK